MKKAFWWILGILLSPVLLFAVLVGLLYLPPVQNWAVRQVAETVSEQTGMQITVGHVDLSFPLDLVLDDFRALKDGDTIADVRRLVADVQLRPLLHSRVVVDALQVSQGKLNTNGFVNAVRVKGDFKHLSVTSRGIDLARQTVEVNGARLEDARLDIAMNDSVPEDTTSTPTRWKIHFDDATILRSDVTFHMPGDTMSVRGYLGSLIAREGNIDLGTSTYSVGSIDWNDGRLAYDQNYVLPVSGLDYNHIDLTRLDIGVDSIYYRAPTLRLNIRQMALKEKSGLEVTELAGPVTMDDGMVTLPRFHLKTPGSDLYAELDMPLSLTDTVSPGQMSLLVDAQLGREDLSLFMQSVPKAVQERWPHYPLTVRGRVKGNLDRMELSSVDVSLPTAFEAQADGFIARLNDPKRLQADVQFKSGIQNVDFLMAALSRDVQRNYRIPAGLRAEGRVKADGVRYAADVLFREDGGTAKLEGSLDSDVMRYDAFLSVNSLNVHHFMPRDSIYTVTADINAKGQGTDFFSPRTTLSADADISQLHYGTWKLTNMVAQADIRNGRARVNVDSHNDLINGTIGLDALMNRQKLDGTLTADLSRADLYRLHLTDLPLTIGVCGHVDITSDLKLTHTVSGLFNDLTIADSSRVFRPSDIGLLVKTRTDTTYVRAQSGDFIVKLDASGDYERLLRQIEILNDSVRAQVEQKIIDQPALKPLLPTMSLHVESKRDNPVVTFLSTSQNLDFQTLLLDITSSPVSGLNGKGHIHSLTVGDTRLDTINFRLTQRDNRLSFGGQIRNNKKNPDFVFNALFDGAVQGRGATVGLRYYDSKDRLGARIGAQAEMVDSGLSFHLVPARPILGYKEFNLNKDNYILLGRNKRVDAKVDLIADDGTGVKIYSEASDPTALQDITVSLNRFNLDEVTSVIPYAPRMTGLLNGDFHVVVDAEGQLSMVSDMAVQNLTYERNPIGNVSTELVYLQREDDAHAVEARLMKDDQEIGLLTGTYYNKDKGAVDARLLLERLPLSIGNGFVPDRLFGLQGYGEGELTIKGTASKLDVNGEVYLDSAYMESIPYGVTLRFDNDPVRVVNSRLLFENFTVYAYNDNPLNVQGDINFENLSNMLVNLRMRAQNFQIIGAPENPRSVAYGKAFVNVYATMAGTVSNLSMRGRLDVLGSTDMSYVLRDTPLTTDNQLAELVKFTDFADTAQVVVERPSLDGFKMDMTVDVSNGAHVMAYLNTDHSNYIDLMGGGTLRLQYSPADNLQLRGRYTLSNGEMKYSLPVIPLKTFTIQDGSYIEFTGEPMNPTLHITATERVKAAVSGSSGAGRSVDFDCGVKITKTLNEMGVEFTLDAPEDMELHNELQTMGADQRGKLAVSMLTTGMYLADGNTSAFSMNSALSTFLNSEINNITGNALRTLDLSFGMDNSLDAMGNSHTDYSFKFAKRFMNNRLKIAVGGLVSTGSTIQQRNNSFFDNVTLEYRLDDTANKFVTLFFQNNSYDWLDGYTQKYGGGFIWRRKLQTFWDIFRFKEQPAMLPARQPRPSAPADTLNTHAHDTK